VFPFWTGNAIPEITTALTGIGWLWLIWLLYDRSDLSIITQWKKKRRLSVAAGIESRSEAPSRNMSNSTDSPCLERNSPFHMDFNLLTLCYNIEMSIMFSELLNKKP
jgi:hypothetical protein